MRYRRQVFNMTQRPIYPGLVLDLYRRSYILVKEHTRRISLLFKLISQTSMIKQVALNYDIGLGES